VNAGFGVLYEFPRVGLGIGLAENASIEGNFGVFAGGSFRLGGIKVSKEEQLVGRTHEIYREGRADGRANPAACK
jgi:hypothetical protein